MEEFKMVDISIPIEKIDEEITQFIYNDGTVIFALDKDTCQRIVINFKETGALID